MATGARSAYIVLALPSYCKCSGPRSEVSTHNKLERAIPVAMAHWSIYITFFGHLTHCVDIVIVDTRDGSIQWKNGKLLKEREDG